MAKGTTTLRIMLRASISGCGGGSCTPRMSTSRRCRGGVRRRPELHAPETCENGETMTTQALESAWTIPSRWYTDPTHYARERERVLSKAWHYACHLDHVKERGSYYSVDVCGEPVVIVHGDDDAVRAFSNVCRH